MKRMILAAAAAVTFLALAAPVPTQAAMVNPGLNSAVPAAAVDVQYRRHYRTYRRDWRSHRSYRRSRHCWNERIRVRVPGGHFVIRTHRRCGWRSW